MRDAPDVDALLEAARESLLGVVLLEAPAAQRREIRMAANAIAIARRMIAAGDAPLHEELALLAAVYGERAPRAHGEPLAAALRRLNTRLARDIRHGVFDDSPATDAVRALLWRVTEQKLRENRPKRLDTTSLTT